jgi:putative ABC transport system permease protein
MVRHFITSSRRYFRKNASAGILNVLGLAIGMATAILILEYVFHELSYDRFHKNKQDIFRLIIKEEKESAIEPSAFITAAVAPSMAEEFPEVETYVRFMNPADAFFTYEDKNFFVKDLSYADSAFFEVFSFKLIKGDSRKALAEPHRVVLTETSARNIFGNVDPIGKVVRLNGKDNLIVTGLMKDFPTNSHLHFGALVSFSSLYLDKNLHLDWNGGWNYLAYVKLHPGANINDLKAKFPAFMEKNINYLYREAGFILHLDLQKLARVHLFSGKDFGIDEAGNLSGIYIFSSIAVFILLIACINFINLTTARSFDRAREIGLRKVSGASRKNIIIQFLFETLILTLLALIVAVLFSDLFQLRFNQLMNKELSLFGPMALKMMAAVTVLVFLTSLAAGIYPAWFISRFPPLLSIRGTMFSGKGKSGLRNVLVVFQFVISIVLIILTLVIYRQMNYLNSKSPGYNGENVVVIPMLGENTMSSYAALKDVFSMIPQVSSSSASSAIPGQGFTMNGYLPEGYREPIMIHVLDVDADYLALMEIPLVQGRGFDNLSGADSMSFIINETLARKLGWENPVGKSISRDGKHPVIGVIADFHFASLHHEIQPLILTRQPWLGYNYLSVRIRESDREETMQRLERAWTSVVPEEPFSSFLLEDYRQGAYTGEKNTGEAIFWFSFLAIFIAGIGLFGLASFTFSQRRKEIGIRKVLGAASGQIARQITASFLRLVMIASLIALPIAWFLMIRWLENFAFRTPVSLWVFAAPILIVALLAWLTIHFQVRKLARTNPADVLKFE